MEPGGPEWVPAALRGGYAMSAPEAGRVAIAAVLAQFRREGLPAGGLIALILAFAPGCMVTGYAYDKVARVDEEPVGEVVALRLAGPPAEAVADVIERRPDGSLVAFRVDRAEARRAGAKAREFRAEGSPAAAIALPPGGLPVLFVAKETGSAAGELERLIVREIAADGRIAPESRPISPEEAERAILGSPGGDGSVLVFFPPPEGRALGRDGERDRDDWFVVARRREKVGCQALHVTAFALLLPFTLVADLVLSPYEIWYTLDSLAGVAKLAP
jgi:hypothetical protein